MKQYRGQRDVWQWGTALGLLGPGEDIRTHCDARIPVIELTCELFTYV
jgi:hypothetical protein